jgi:hypothetical protein
LNAIEIVIARNVGRLVIDNDLLGIVTNRAVACF